MRTKRREWAHDELLIAFRLYCRTAFGRLHQRNSEIIQLARRLDRTAGALAMKACNFASLDPRQQARGIRGLGNVSRADRELWEAFLSDSEAVAEESEAAYFALTGNETEHFHPEAAHVEPAIELDRSIRSGSRRTELEKPKGPTEMRAVVKTRRVQSFFRAAVLTSYDGCCALTGLAIPELLNASHIVPWKVDEKRRADPRNGICLNAFHDRAFDRGLISLDERLRVIVSSTIGQSGVCDIHRQQLAGIAGFALRLPKRFQPEVSALEYHRNHVFRP